MTHFSAIAIGIFLLAQPAGDADPYKPRVVPSKRPAAAIEIEPRQDLPGAPAESSQPAAAEPALAEPPSATPEPQSGPDAPAHEAAPDASLAPLGNVPPQRLRPPELIAEALTTPREGALVGQPLDLLTAISRSADRQQQLRIANTYWKLSAAQARYHWALAGQTLVDSATAAHASAPEAASARAAASADLRNAQVAVAEAQQELGDLVGMSGENQPLTVDRPHVGSYSTVYEEIFGVRPAPPRIRLIHRTLPLRRKAIDAHGEAIVASLDALESARDELQNGRQSLAGMLNGLEEVQRERQAFLATVLEYNREIAEYLFSVARPGTSDQVLVSRLILTGPKPGTRLDGPPARRPGTPGAPTLADPAAARELPAGAEHLSRYRAEVTEGSADDRGVYSGLADLSPPARVQKLSELMHWDRSTAANEGVHEAPLADALRGANPAARLAIVTSYWQARQAAARCQVLTDQVEQLNGLARLARANHDQEHVAAAAVQVQAARRVAKAALAEAQLALVQGEFDLTQAAGRSLDQPWLHAVTPPQSGRYIVARDDRLSGPALQWARIVKVQHVALQERADAVLAADDRRALAGAAVRDAAGSTVADSTPLSNLLTAVNWQTRQSLAFLDDLTGYNQAIVRYVMATSPPSMDSDELVRWLVIPRTARGET